MDFSPDYTSRIVYKYVAAGVTHNLLLRGRISETLLLTQSRAEGVMASVSLALVSLMPEDFAVVSGTYYTTASNIGFPIAPAPTTEGANIVSAYSKQDKITHLTFQGRSSGGTKVSLKWYCPQLEPDAVPTNPAGDFRFNPGEEPAIDAAVAALNASGLNAVDGLTVIWHGFVNVKVNDYWLRQARKGAL